MTLKGMRIMCHILVAGGDKRNVYLADILSSDEFRVSVCGFGEEISFTDGVNRAQNIKKTASECDVIILPLPVSFDGITLNAPFGNECVYIEDILSSADKNCIIAGGRVSKDLMERYPQIIDYSKRDDFSFLNAVPTAEGAIEAAMKENPRTLAGSDCMVTGFGKCSRALSLRLKALGCRVDIFARSAKDIAHAQCMGFNGIYLSSLNELIGNYDMIFNTVPFGIFSKNATERMKENVVFIDIASAPGGIAEDADKSKFSYHFLPGLPGKYSPYTAAEIIKKVISAIMLEKGKGA